MAIDPRRKKFVMNMQLRQCFARAKPIRLKISLKEAEFSGVFHFPKKPKVFKKQPEFQNLASKKPNWQPYNTRIEIARKVHKTTSNFLLCIEVQKT